MTGPSPSRSAPDRRGRRKHQGRVKTAPRRGGVPRRRLRADQPSPTFRRDWPGFPRPCRRGACFPRRRRRSGTEFAGAAGLSGARIAAPVSLPQRQDFRPGGRVRPLPRGPRPCFVGPSKTGARHAPDGAEFPRRQNFGCAAFSSCSLPPALIDDPSPKDAGVAQG